MWSPTDRGRAYARAEVTVIDWLIPDADYAKLPRPAAETRPPRLAQIATTANGPASTHLLTVLTNAGLNDLLPEAPTPMLTDRKSPRAPVSGSVTYAFANDNGVFAAHQQQMMRPYPYSVVGLTDGARLTKRPTGSLLVSYSSRAANQVFLVSASGIMTAVTASGVQSVAAPLTIDQLVALATAIDSRPAATPAYPG
jgi:hypothetical protein